MMVPRPAGDEQAPSPTPAVIAAPAAGNARAGGHRPGDEHSLAEEHEVLLHQVRGRVRAIRTALGSGRWPAEEVRALVDYLRYELLDQAVTEERLLFPMVGRGWADSRIHQLVDDHVHLRDVTDALDGAATAEGRHQEPDELLETVDGLEGFLEEHMRVEQAALSSAAVAGVESARRPFRCHSWFPLTEGQVLDLEVLPREFAQSAVAERLGRMRPGDHLALHAAHPLDGLWSAVACRLPGEYGWDWLEEGPTQWRADVTRRTPE
jgi:uncharacterized protein (DUF2249 family)/hemerythrin-like domain-containing protein